MNALVLQVRFHDGRFHGQKEWPPSPSRLFQALVAGIGLGGPIGGAETAALEWLEEQNAPIVAAPFTWQSRKGVCFYVPNNDGDKISGDPARIADIRTEKVFQPYFFDVHVPFLYAWSLRTNTDKDELERARSICSLAEHLYQFGRGIDMAWAWGEVLDQHQLDELLAAYPGSVFRPSVGRGETRLLCPCDGSLESLVRRYRAYSERICYRTGSTKVVFRSPPKALFQSVSYDSPPSRQLFELREPTAKAAFASWSLVRVTDLVVRSRDSAVSRLEAVLPESTAEIRRVLVGRKPDGTNDGPLGDRVRIIPLPSIGHVHADRAIRRLLIEVPPNCPISSADVYWAFSGLTLVDVESGEIKAIVTPTDDHEFLRHYGLNDGDGYRLWRTVTPAALPEYARRRRIDPARMREDAKSASERSVEQIRAAEAVCQALRHTGLRERVEVIRVQREPFEGKGSRVEEFARGTRFPKERLRHVEIRFAEPVAGPLVIGDGRFLGLGVMAPVPIAQDVHAVSKRRNRPGQGEESR